MGNHVPFRARIEGRISGPRTIVTPLLLVRKIGLIEDVAMRSCCLQESLPTTHLEISLVAKEGVLASDATVHLAGAVSIETHCIFSESAFLPSVNRLNQGTCLWNGCC